MLNYDLYQAPLLILYLMFNKTVSPESALLPNFISILKYLEFKGNGWCFGKELEETRGKVTYCLW